MAIYLLAGHYLGPAKPYTSGSRKGKQQSTGTASKGVSPQVSERDAAIELRGLIAKYLKKQPITEGDYKTIEETRAWLKSVMKPGDIAIELHFDSNDGTSPGTKDLIHPNASAQAKSLGKELTSAMASVTGVPNKGLLQSGKYFTWEALGAEYNVHMFEVCAMSASEFPKYAAKKDQVAKALADVINRYDTGTAASSASGGASTGGTPWMDIAKSYLGRSEAKDAAWVASLHKESGYGGSAKDAWCGSFVAHCLRKAGVDVPKDFWAPLAKNWESFPNAEPITDLNNIPYGAVVTLLSTTGSKRHVTFFMEKTATGIRALGGNQSNAVTMSNDNRKIMYAMMPKGFGGSTPTGSTAGGGGYSIDIDPKEANVKANEAAKALLIQPEQALEEVQVLPRLLLQRADAIERDQKGLDVGKWSFDVNTETEIEAVVNSITVGSAYIKNSVVNPNQEYGKLSTKDLVDKVFPWNKYINPFYYEMFGKEFHKDMSVKPLYFWPQYSILPPDLVTHFDAAGMYTLLHNNHYKSGLLGRVVESNDVTNTLSKSAKASVDNDDHDNPEAMFLMLEKRYVKHSREEESKDIDPWDFSDMLASVLEKVGLPPAMAKAMALSVVSATPLGTIQLVGNTIKGVASLVSGAAEAATEWATGDVNSTYTGEFSEPIRKAIGSLQQSQGLGIMAGHDPKLAAFADLVSRHEGTHEARGSDGYRTYYARAFKLDLNSGHPNKKIKGGRHTSSAAGRYQALYSTWVGVWGSNKPMTKANQDEFFIKLVKENKAYDIILRGDWYKTWEYFATKRPSTWTSLPTSLDKRVSVQGTPLTGKQWIEAATMLQKFYEGAKVGSSVTVEGPNAIQRGIAAVSAPPKTSAPYSPDTTYRENTNMAVRVRPKAGSLGYKKNVGGLTEAQYQPLAKTRTFKLGTGPGTVKSVNVLDAGLLEIVVRNPGEVKFIAIPTGIRPPKLARYTGHNTNEYFASEAKKIAEDFLEGTSWFSDKNDFSLTVDGYSKELGVAIVNLQKKGLYYNTYMINKGAAFAINNQSGVAIQDKARQSKVGMWADTSKIYEGAIAAVNSVDKGPSIKTNVGTNIGDFPTRTSMSEIFSDKVERKPTKTFSYNSKTNQWITTVTFKASTLIAPLPGVLRITKTTTPGGIVATLKTDVKDLTLKYYNLHEKSFDVVKESQEKRVNAGDVIGTAKGTGRVAEVPFEATFREVPFNPLAAKDLSTWPTTGFRLGDYLNKDGFKSGSMLVSQLDWVRVHSDGGTVTTDAVEGNPPSDSLPEEQKKSYEQLRGHRYDILRDADKESPLRDSASVFSNTVVFTNVMRNYLKPFQYGNSLMVPQIKGYVVIGNEDDDYYAEGVALRQPVIYELPAIQSFSLSCNSDENPVDVARFVVMNPSHTLTSPFYFDYNKGADINAAHTQFYNRAFLEKARIKAGTRVSFKIGYTNNPNFNPTVFNGVIKETGGEHDQLIECIAEGFGAELLNSEYGSEKPINFTNGHNASTGSIFGLSLLDEGITHFGARLGRWRTAIDYVGSIFRDQHVDEFASGAEWQNDTIFEGKGRIGDMRDPENKALVAPWSWGDNLFNLWFPTRANAAHRAYMNIFSDVIESVHDDFATTLSLWLNLLSWDKAGTWRYFAYKSSPWSIMKEMEYRHPGTLAKPLIFEERMTMFYGIPFQQYIARDLKPHFMMSTALANRFESLNSPYTTEYLKARPTRMEPSTNYHLLHSDINIISNRLTLSRDFYTRVNVLEYNRTYDGHEPTSSSDVITMTLDDNLASHEIRTKTIAMGGTHKEHSAYLYGTAELKREAEKMYGGQIVIVGNPHIKAGDYAYLHDRVRGLTGTIKIRECEHHITEDDGYITVITPGLWVEPSQFAWSSHLMVLTAFGKYTAESISELAVEDLINDMASYQSIILASVNHKNTRLSDILFTGGVTGAFATLAGRTAYKLAKSILGKTTIKGAVDATRWAGRGVLNTFRAYGGKSLHAIRNSKRLRTAGGFIKTTASKWKWFTKLGGISKWLKGGRALGQAMSIGRNALMAARGVTAFFGTFLASTPIVGWIALAVGQVALSFVAAKVNKVRMTRQPISFVPLTYNYGPYVAGVDGFINNSYLESMWHNLKQTWKTVVKAKQYYTLNHGDATNSYWLVPDANDVNVIGANR